MSVDRIDRVNELIRREIGDAFFRLITDARFDRSAVTVTEVTTSRNLRSAKVLISVRGDKQRQQQMLSIVRRYRTELQQAVNRDLSIKFTPVLRFELDPSLQKGDKVLDLLAHLDPSFPDRSDDFYAGGGTDDDESDDDEDDDEVDDWNEDDEDDDEDDDNATDEDAADDDE